MAVTVQNATSCDVTPCSLVSYELTAFIDRADVWREKIKKRKNRVR